MTRRAESPARSRAALEIQDGIRRLTRGLRLLAREVLKEAARTGAAAPKRRVSPGRRIHGRYIGLIRNLARQEKAKVRAVRARKGVEAAIRMAEELRRAS